MIRSMTGYGRREGVWNHGAVSVEVRSVNHRFLEVVTRFPRLLAGSEEPLKKAVQQRCLRGRVEVIVTLSGGKTTSRSVSLDPSLARQYHRALQDLQKTLRLSGTIDVALLSGFREMLMVSDQPLEADQALTKLVQRLLTHALSDFNQMRRREGTALSRDISHRLKGIRQAKSAVETRTPVLAQEAFARMKSRVEKLLGGDPPDVARLHQELAVYADRVDVTEELVRLDSHMLQFEQTLKRDDSVGKTLDFLIQEIGREVNTIGSKANNAEITGLVVQMKSELEKIREQVQNIE